MPKTYITLDVSMLVILSKYIFEVSPDGEPGVRVTWKLPINVAV